MHLYLHFPFCPSKCPYCDFCSFTAEEATRRAYLQALQREMETVRRTDEAAGGDALSVYCGGGTPSLYPPGELGEVLERLASLWPTAPGAEVTVEVNPATWGAEEVAEARAAGFNRFSLGIQSFDGRVLQALGRIHGPREARSLARAACGLEGASVGFDLIYGVPGQGLASWEDTLEEALSFGPHHLSTYALTLDPSTPMGARVESGEMSLADDELAADMYHAACRVLKGAGYRHYEISNFCLQGRECSHNLACWKREGYLGLGASAHSFAPPAARRRNLSDLGAYMREASGGRLPREEEEWVSPGEAWEEEVMLSLRTAEGAEEGLFEGGGNAAAAYWDGLVEAGMAWREGGRCGLTERGMFVSNHIISGLFAG